MNVFRINKAKLAPLLSLIPRETRLAKEGEKKALIDRQSKLMDPQL